jgi:hypothetical protein
MLLHPEMKNVMDTKKTDRKITLRVFGFMVIAVPFM